MSIATTQASFSVVAIPTEIVQRVRETLRDDFGNTLELWDSGPVPCRHCLRISVRGERAILFAYRPFERICPYAEVGPVFVHAQHCERYSEAAMFPGDFRQRVLAMRGYNEAGHIENAELSEAGTPESSIARLFENERVRFIHVRNPAWGCYDFRVDRAS